MATYYAKKSEWAEAKAKELDQLAAQAREKRVPTFAPPGKVRAKMQLIGGYLQEASRMRQIAQRLRSKGQ